MKPVKVSPFNLIVGAPIAGAVAYGGLFALMVSISPPTDGDSTAWMAFLFGFFGVFIVPPEWERSLSTAQFLMSIFLVHGAVLGLIGGLIGALIAGIKGRKSTP